MTTVALLRLRYKLTVHGRRERLLLAEEAAALAWDAGRRETVLPAEAARALLEQPASRRSRRRSRDSGWSTKAREQMPAALDGSIARLCPRAGAGAGRGPRAGPRGGGGRAARHGRAGPAGRRDRPLRPRSGGALSDGPRSHTTARRRSPSMPSRSKAR